MVGQDEKDFEKDWVLRMAEFSKGREKEFVEALSRHDEGVKLQNMGLWDEAIQQYQLATNLIPDFPDFYVNLGYCFAQKDMHDEAIKIFQNIMKMSPGLPNVSYYLGDSYFCKGMHDEARNSYQAEISISGEKPDIHFKIGIVYASKGEKAIQDAIGRGVKQKEGLAYVGGPSFEKGLLEFLRAKELGFVFGSEDNEYFDRVCRALDEINPGKLQEIGVPLTLDRLHKVIISSSCKEEPRKEMFQVEFNFRKPVRSGVMYTCVSGQKRQEAYVWLFSEENPDPTKVAQGQQKPIGQLSLTFPGYDMSTGKDNYEKASCSVSDYTKITCDSCNGSGKCNYCKGEGKTGAIFKKPCSYCNSTGKCQKCNGVGKIDS